jgi:prophage regulatory protein
MKILPSTITSTATVAQDVKPQLAWPDDRFLRLSEVERVTGLSRTSLWRLRRAGAFPKGYAISPNTRRWLASEIHAWIRSKLTSASVAS